MFKQISQFFENIKFQYPAMSSGNVKKRKRSANNSKMFDALPTDLSKLFHRIDEKILIAKLNAYCFSLTVLKLVRNYLSNRKQRTKTNSSHSSWLEIIFGFLERSILRLPLLNNFLIDCSL